MTLSMLVFQDKIVLKVVQQLNGLSKIEALDVLQKVEELLFDYSGPVQEDIIKTILQSKTIFDKNIINVPIDCYCFLEDISYWIKIYRCNTTNINKNKQSLYFSVLESDNIILLTSENLLKAYLNTKAAPYIEEFIKNNHVTKRNRTSERLALIELFNTIDPLK